MKEHKRDDIRLSDRFPNIKSLLAMCEELPAEACANIGENLLQSIELYQRRYHGELNLKNLGTPVVLSLYKSKRKLRWYDPVPQLHRSLNLMLFLPEEILQTLDQKCFSLVEYIRDLKAQELYHPEFVALKIDLFLKDRPFTEIREGGSHIMGNL